jgi:hypothetical protein
VVRVRFIIIFLSTLSIAASLQSQIELVPADHEVYTFLKRMQVRGVLTAQYSGAYRPYDRQTVAELIRNVSERRSVLSRAEYAALQRYMIEFSFELSLPRGERVSLLNDGLGRLFGPRQKYLYRYEDATAVLTANLLLRTETQYRDIGTIPDKYTSLWQLGGGLSGTFGGWFGFSLHAVNGYIGGSRELGKQNIEVLRTYKIEEPDSRFYDITRGHIRAAHEWGSVTIGRERLIAGNGPMRSSLMFSDYAAEIDYIGLDLRYKRFFFNFFHGWILGDEEFVFLDEGVVARNLTEKYVSFHRFGLYFFDARMHIALSEIIVYGGRGFEIAYLNPFLFFKSVEHSLRDRDKALLALDMQIRPRSGMEIYGDVIIDDLAFDKLGTNWYGNQYAFRLGVTATPQMRVLRDATFNIDYVRIQPYVYTHRLPMNRYVHGGFPLGNPVGPNSDAWRIGWNHLLSGRSGMEVYFSRVRKGHNVTDDEGNLLRNVGGDISQGFRPDDSENVYFLDGNLEKSDIIGILLRYEILHQFFLTAGYEIRRRNELWKEQTFDEHFMFGRIVIEL